jgi:hypothetical protein
LVLSGLVHLGIFALDDRPWSGPVSWRKPFTFGVSFGLTLATVLWVTSYLRMSPRLRLALIAVFAVDCVLEVGGITVQAWRGVPSHLNTSTPTDAAIAYTLAAGGAVLVVVLGAFCVVALRGRVDGPPDLVLAVRVGSGLLLVGLASGAAMIARGTVEMRTGTTERAYQVAGFLKDFHGLTLHAILVLPALAWLMTRGGVAEQTRRRVVAGASVGYLLLGATVLAADLGVRL